MICGIMTGEHPSEEVALEQCQHMKGCPYLVTSGTTGKTVHSVFIVPEEKRWWLEYPSTDPSATGLGKAALVIIENVIYHPALEMKIPAIKNEITPCGDNCSTCVLREKFNCKGCPATVHYKE